MLKIIEVYLEWAVRRLKSARKLPGLGGLALVTLGAVVISFGLSAFLLNASSNITIGLGGLSRIIEEAASGTVIAQSYSSIIGMDMSFLLFWLLSGITWLVGSLRKNDTEGFVLKSLAAFTIVSLVFLPLFRSLGFNDWLLPLPVALSWLALPINAVFGGLLLAIGIGIILIGGGSTCGPDLIGVVISEKIGQKYSDDEKRKAAEMRSMKYTMRVFDTTVVVLGAIVFGADSVVGYILHFACAFLTIYVLSNTVAAIEAVNKNLGEVANSDTEGVDAAVSYDVEEQGVQETNDILPLYIKNAPTSSALEEQENNCPYCFGQKLAKIRANEVAVFRYPVKNEKEDLEKNSEKDLEK